MKVIERGLSWGVFWLSVAVVLVRLDRGQGSPALELAVFAVLGLWWVASKLRSWDDAG